MSGRSSGVRHVALGRLTIALQAVAAILFVAYLLHGDHVRLPFAAATFEVHAAFDDASGLNSRDGHPVMIAGVRVGKVAAVRYEHRQAVATLELDESVRGRLRSDAGAFIEPRSALQDQTVELVPGHAPDPLAAGAVIEADHTRAPIELDQVLSTLGADTRAQLQILLTELRSGLRGRETRLRSDLRALADAFDATGDVAGALADRRRLLARLVGQLDVVFGTLAERRTRLREVLAAGRRTLDTAARRAPDLEAAVRDLPATLDALASAVQDVRGLSGQLVPALDGLQPAAARLPAGLRSLRRFVPRARGLVADLAPVARSGRRPAEDLHGALEALGGAAGPLADPVRRVLPLLRAIDRNRDGIALLGERFSGVFSTNDANGPILRGLGFFDTFDPANFGAPGATGAARAALARKAVRALLQACRSNAAACLARYLVPGLPGALRPGAEEGAP